MAALAARWWYIWVRCFWVQLVYDPAKALDLLDEKGDYDHTKLLGVLAFAADIWLLTRPHADLIPLGHFIVLNCVIFGWPAVRALLKSGILRAHEQVTRTFTSIFKDDETGGHAQREAVK